MRQKRDRSAARFRGATNESYRFIDRLRFVMHFTYFGFSDKFRPEIDGCYTVQKKIRAKNCSTPLEPRDSKAIQPIIRSMLTGRLGRDTSVARPLQVLCVQNVIAFPGLFTHHDRQPGVCWRK